MRLRQQPNTYVSASPCVAGFVANLTVENEDVCTCKEVNLVRFVKTTTDSRELFHSYYCKTEPVDENAVISNAYAIGPAGENFAAFKEMHFTCVKLQR